MLDLDKIRSIQSLPHLSFEDSKLAIFTRLHKYEDALPLVLAELDRLAAELSSKDAEIAALKAGPVVEWRPTFFGAAAQIGLWRLSVGAERWALRLKVPDSLGLAELIDSGEETGDAGKAAAEAAYRRACGLPAIPACAG